MSGANANSNSLSSYSYLNISGLSHNLTNLALSTAALIQFLTVYQRHQY